MKVLVIPDVHLKPWMFERASRLLDAGTADTAVCLMDLPDDWNQMANLSLYEKTFDAAISFAQKYPQAKWCWGNHDLCYLWREKESGYSYLAAHLVTSKLDELRKTLPKGNPIAYVQRMDRVLFSHAGLQSGFVEDFLENEVSASEDELTSAAIVRDHIYDDADAVLSMVNRLGHAEIWSEMSPIWCRPQFYDWLSMYKPEEFLQVVGHTPMEQITRTQNEVQNLLSCDVFSTYRDGKPIGLSDFPVVDSETWEHTIVK